jgi:hypothetical protein
VTVVELEIAISVNIEAKDFLRCMPILTTINITTNSESAGITNIPGIPKIFMNGTDKNGYKILGEYSL